MEQQHMIGDRPSIEEITDRLSSMPQKGLKRLTDNRLRGLANGALPDLARDEDPSDILIECYKRHPDKLSNLRSACVALLANDYSKFADSEIQENPEPLGELLFLCSGMRAQDAVAPMADVASRDGLSTAILAGGEDVQGRALRCMAGLLISGPPGKREEYRHLYETALGTRRHAPIGLTTLAAFWPEHRDQFIRQAKRYNDIQIDQVIDNLDWIVGTFSSQY